MMKISSEAFISVVLVFLAIGLLAFMILGLTGNILFAMVSGFSLCAGWLVAEKMERKK